MAQALDSQCLLEHTDWVRQLAHSLVRDASRAEDIAQAAYLAALERPPKEPSNLRAWLSVVVRNLARRSVRSDARRAGRERLAAAAEALPSSAELVELAERQRELAARVLELAEPYKTSLLLRYYQGLSPEEIAQRSGLPLNTVRSRLVRGLALLRERLDQQYGARQSWCMALLPLLQAKPTQLVVPTTIGVAAMSMPWKLAGLSLAVVLGIWVVWNQLESPHPQGPDLTQAAASSLAEESAALATTVDDAPLSRSTMAPPVEPTAAALAQPAAPAAQVLGRVIDVEQQALARVGVEWKVGSQKIHTQTDEAGRFAFALESPAGEPMLAHAGHTLVMRLQDPQSGAWTLVVAPAVDLAGMVLLPSGEPAAHVDITWECLTPTPAVTQLLAEFGNRFWFPGTRSDAGGAFRLSAAPVLSGAKLRAQAGSAYGHVEIPTESRSDVRIVLEEHGAVRARELAGRVLLENGQPASAAELMFGQDMATCDELGRFQIRVSYYQPHMVLSVHHLGSQPWADASITARIAPEGTRVDDLEIILRAALEPIRGRVLDEQGQPCVAWKLELADGTPWGTTNVTLESAAQGYQPVLSAADGSFRIGGLMQRSYRVRAIDPQTLLRIESAAVLPGTKDLELRVPAQARIERLRVRVVDRLGAPLVGAAVQIETVVGSDSSYESTLAGQSVRTDESGWCELLQVPRQHCRVAVHKGRELRPQSVDFDANTMPNELTITVIRLISMEIQVQAGASFDRVRVLDDKGETLTMELEFPGQISIATVAGLRNGALPLIRVEDNAKTLVLFQGKQEWRRVPIEPDASGLIRLQL